MPRNGLGHRRKRARDAALALAAMAVMGLHAAPADAQPTPRHAPAEAGTPTDDPAARENQESPLILEPEDVNWSAILMAPRITGNFRAVAVDPSDGKRIYAGTEEGTLVHSFDGGVTWQEIELSPFLMQSPTIEPQLSGDDYKAIDVFGGFQIPFGNEYRGANPINRLSAGKGPSRAGPDVLGYVYPQTMPIFFVAPFPVDFGPEPLLDAVAGKDPRPYDELRRIRVCPGGAHHLFVTTDERLFGSSDGNSFVQLFVARESAAITELACSPTNPNEVILSSGDGTFRSTDGGTSFSAIGGSVGTIEASAIAFGPAGEGGKDQIYVASGTDLWIGDPTEPDGLILKYMGGETDAQIRHVAASEHSVWLATDAGVRVSRDAGKTWKAIDDLEGFDWQMIAVAPAADAGREQIAVLREDIAFMSIDGGDTFHPVFRAQSRRTLRQLVASPTVVAGVPPFLLVTSGELWTTTPHPGRRSDVDDRIIRAWAQRRLERMPTLSEMIDGALVKARLSTEQVDGLFSRWNSRGWLPGVGMFGFVQDRNVLTRRQATITDPEDVTRVDRTNNYGVMLDLVWELPDVVLPNANVTAARTNLYEIRKRLSFVVEDAYDERRQVLSKLSAGGHDAEQMLLLQSRVDVLDVVLEQFTGDVARR
jgi:hypothetical protein